MGKRLAWALMSGFLAVFAAGCGGGSDGTGYKIVGAPVNTGARIKAGSVVHVVASGKIDFGGAVTGFGAPKLSADGDTESTPADYPAPTLTKNSLICRVGSRWYQGGVDRTFTPSEDGELILAPNDGHPEDNSRGWFVQVFVIPPASTSGTTESNTNPVPVPPASTTYGPFAISNQELKTQLVIPQAATVHVNAEGLIDFGGAVIGIGAPVLGPSGDNFATPTDYPAPNLRKNSLIVRVGSTWYQGGSDETFVPTEQGTLTLRPNDPHLEDNSRGWTVTVTVTP
jgi:hypothetical protein